MLQQTTLNTSQAWAGYTASSLQDKQRYITGAATKSDALAAKNWHNNLAFKP